jgi:Ca-activated chloride channel family protein
MTWAHSSYLWLLLVAALAVPLSAWAWSRRVSDLQKLVSAAMLEQLVSAGTSSARTVQAVMVPLVLGALAVALAGPRSGFDWQQQKMEGVSIVAVLDVSRSMDAADSSPSRLVVAKRELGDFSGMLRGDAIGLVLFAQGAWTRIPLTTDYATWRWALEDTSTATIRAQGTSLSGALDAAVKLLDRADGSGKAVLLVSDGEDHDADDDLSAALSRTRDAGVHVYVLGVGTPEGAPVPMEGGGFKKDDDGNVVVSKLDEARLKGVAEATGGAYVRSVPGDDDVRGLYEQEIRGKLTASERGVRRDKLWHEQFQWPLGLALCAMVFGAVLGVRRR